MSSSPYAPYRSLAELLEAAGVKVPEMDRFSTQELLDRAKLRGGAPAPTPNAAPRMGPPLKYGRPGEARTTRTVGLTWELEQAVDRKARAAGMSFSAVVRTLLENYVHGE